MEKVILAGILYEQSSLPQDPNLKELEDLVVSAGGNVITKIVQKREKADPAYLIGKGKAEELAERVWQMGANCVVFDDELTPTQQRNLEEALGIKVIDRTHLILDVFAQRARTKEGMLQVELAQHMYILPRLGGKGTTLSQQSGGIGTRGPGERKLEYDRRSIRSKIQHLKKELEAVKQERQTQRSKRLQEGIPQIAIVGYTNVGKSSLLNCLAAPTDGKAPIYADNRLFATLDPTTRRVHLPSGLYSLFTDTVGFISKLPTLLIASFRATLEEIKWADILIEVSDPTLPEETFSARKKAVDDTLKELSAQEYPRLNIFSKADLLEDHQKRLLEKNYPQHIVISSQTGEGIVNLLQKVEETLMSQWPRQEITLNISDGHLLRYIYSVGKVLKFKEDGKGKYKLTLQAPKSQIAKIRGALRKAIK